MVKKKKEVNVSELISSRKILSGVVSKLGYTDDGVAYMEVPVGGYPGIITLDESDGENDRRSLFPLLNRRVIYLALRQEENGRVICSRKQAQILTREQMMDSLTNKEPLDGTVIETAPYGVFIEVNGISGLLKNKDYINNSIPVGELLPIGTKVKVICKEISDAGRIQWAPAEKPEAEPITFDAQVNTCVTGTVTNLQPFKSGGVGVFVRIQRGVDALCLLPPNMEVNKSDTVALKIVNVEPPQDDNDPPRIRGKLLRVMN